jgi:hypothetical protein
MKKLVVILLSLLPAGVIAQDMNQQDMMAQMQEMSVCMQSIDQEKLQNLGNVADKFEAEMKTLCQQGKRDEAQEKAIKFSRKMMDSPTLKELINCTEKIPASMREMMPSINTEDITKDYNSRHVCDEM